MLSKTSYQALLTQASTQKPTMIRYIYRYKETNHSIIAPVLDYKSTAHQSRNQLKGGALLHTLVQYKPADLRRRFHGSRIYQRSRELLAVAKASS